MILFCSKIRKYTKDLDKEHFEKSEMVIDAVLRNLELIGEASRRLPEGFREDHGKIPWKKIIGLRNIVIHEYRDVDLHIIWDILKINLPNTEELIIKIYSEEYK